MLKDTSKRRQRRITALRNIGMALAMQCLCLLAATPGVGAQEAISSASEIDYPPFCIVENDGTVTGFSNELLRAAARVMGRDVTFRTGPWSDVRRWLENGEVQALPLVGRTPEREKLFDFTFPYMSIHGAIVVREDTRGIHTLEDLKGHSVGVMQGDNAEEFLRRKDRGIDIHTTPTFVEALEGLSQGQFDAVVIQRLVAVRLLSELGLTNLRIINRSLKDFQQDFCFAVKEGDRDTLALLNEGLSIIMADGTYRRLYSKWFAALQMPTNRRIVIGGDANYPPYEYLDEKGRPAGYNVELTRAIAREMGFEVEFRLGRWAETVEALKDGEIDAIQGMFYTPEREKTLDFSQPHVTNHYIAVTRKGELKPPGSLDDLKGKKIVTERGDAILEILGQNGLDNNVALVESYEDALRQVSEGTQDVALVVRISALNLMEKHTWSNLALGGRPVVSMEYCYAVANGQRALLAQFSEGLSVLAKKGELRRIQEKWFGVYREDESTWYRILRHVVLIFTPFVIVLLLVLLWSWSLRRQVAKKTRELEASARRFRHVFESANVGKSITLPTGEVKVNQAFAEFLGYSAEDMQGKTWQDMTFGPDRDITQHQLDSLIDGSRNSVRFEKRYIHRNGSLVWADISTTLRRDERGEPEYFITTVVNIHDRKLAEEALRESEERHRNYIVNTPYGVFVTDEQGHFQQVNPAACRITGYGEQELLSMGIPDLQYDEEGLRQGMEHFQRLIREGKSEGELTFRTKSGERRWWNVSAVKLSDTRFLGFCNDITEHKAAEEALRESEERFRRVYENMSIGIAQISLDFVIMHANEAYCHMLGYSPDEIEGMHLRDITQPEIIEDNLRLQQQLVHGGIDHYRMDKTFIHKDGHTVYGIIDANLIRDAAGNPLYTLGSVLDITERKKAEEDYRTLFREMLDGFALHEIICDDQGVAVDYRFLTINPAFERMTGLKAEAVQGRTVLEVLPETEGRWIETYGHVALTGEPTYFENFAAALGKHFAVTAFRPAPMQFATIFQDITQRKRSEQEREKLEAQLQQARKLESVGRLAGGVAHDFNNMLSVILGYTELSMGKIDPADPLHADLAEILTAAERSADIASQLLAFARRQTISPRVLDLNAMVANMLKMLRRLIGEDIELLWEPENDLWSVSMDPSQLNQIMANLCLNARDAIGGVGKITIETGKRSFGEDYCSDHAEFVPGDYVLLAISDDGCGMEKETLDNIFEPFFTTKGLREGTGLGLATVYGIVRQNNGFINVYSEPDKGTTFRIYLPRHGSEADHVEPRDDETAIPLGNNETILIVEDEVAILHMTRRILEGLHYRVLEASTPGQAIGLAEVHKDRIDLLITDVVMPEMNGRDLAERLKAGHPDLKIMFMSGYTANVIAHRGVLDAGVQFIQKPFSNRNLAIKVRETLES